MALKLFLYTVMYLHKMFILLKKTCKCEQCIQQLINNFQKGNMRL